MATIGVDQILMSPIQFHLILVFLYLANDLL